MIFFYTERTSDSQGLPKTLSNERRFTGPNKRRALDNNDDAVFAFVTLRVEVCGGSESQSKTQVRFQTRQN